MADLSILKPTELVQFPDDTTIFVSDINVSRPTIKPQKAVETTEEWYKKWQLNIYTNKTNAMLITNRV